MQVATGNSNKFDREREHCKQLVKELQTVHTHPWGSFSPCNFVFETASEFVCNLRFGYCSHKWLREKQLNKEYQQNHGTMIAIGSTQILEIPNMIQKNIYKSEQN